MGTIVLYSILLIVLTPPLGAYMYRVYTRPGKGRLESIVYRLIGVNPEAEQTWRRYASSVLWFSVVSMLFIYFLMRLQHHLPLNPQGLPAVSPYVSLNTATSFVTNTNWQVYGGETTMSYLSQMFSLTFQNFLSAAVGMAVLIAMIRGFTRKETENLGNFWRDTVRGVVYILLPLAVIEAIILMSQGVVQSLGHYPTVVGLQGFKQLIATGPAASQIAIKQLGTNGGGFFNVNSAHPFENPTPISNFVEMFSILWIPAALTYTYGKLVGSVRQGWVLFAAMWILMVVGIGLTVPGEHHATPAMQAAGISASSPNLEGKEVRIGPDESSLWAVTTTDASNGSVNSMHDSYQALAGMVPLFNIAVGEVIWGGVGSGLYGMIFYVVIAVFIGGLMVGRTPEYLGKKIRARQVKIVVIAILVPFLVALAFTAVAVVIPAGLKARLNAGPHGFSEILYTYLSQGNNNGSAFAGLTASGPFYAITGGIAMLVARFVPLLAALSLGASVGKERTVPFTAGTLRTDTGLFVGLLIGVIVIIGALTFLPALALRPIVEHLTHGEVVLMAVQAPEAPEAPRRSAERVSAVRARPLFDPPIVKRATIDSVTKLNPMTLLRNPVIFVVEVVSVVVTIRIVSDIVSGGAVAFDTAIAIGLWFTVLFANFAEAMAEGRGKAQADSLRKTRADLVGQRLASDGREESVPATELRAGDVVMVRAGELIPGDGDIIEGIASVDESAITGESAPVIRESGGDRSAVTGGTKVLSDWIKVQITAQPGESFIDRMIKLVEGAERQKTPNEIALSLLLVKFTIIFLMVIVALQPFAIYAGRRVSDAVLIALFVCLIPTTIGGLLSAIGIAGMDRLVQRNVLAMSGRAVEAAGDVSALLLDKTGTITLGNRQAVAFFPAPGVPENELAEVAQLASLADETPEGRSIVVLAKDRFGLRERDLLEARAKFVPFTAQTRMSGVDLDGSEIRKGAVDAVVGWSGRELPPELEAEVVRIARAGGTPLAVAKDRVPVGVIELKDIIKDGLAERFAQLRRMGIRTVMITGDNPLTAAAIAQESGVDDFLAEATPETKMALIKKEQEGGVLVAMTGDGTNDAPALAQADVGVAMNTGTSAAKEAGNMVDLDSNPTKLMDIVEIGKQLLITRGALTTFSIANDVSKYFAIIPAMFAGTLPALNTLNIMHLRTPQSAILSAVIFNAIIIVLLVPLALRGVRYRPIGAEGLLRRNLLIYGLGGIIAPFIGIKLIDLLLQVVHFP